MDYLSRLLKADSLCLNFFHLLARKPNLENFSIYSNKFFHNFHFTLVRIQFCLSQASGKCVSVKTGKILIFNSQYSLYGGGAKYLFKHHIFHAIQSKVNKWDKNLFFFRFWLKNECTNVICIIIITYYT